PAAARRDRVLVSENVGCNDKGFQIRHLELPSRGDTGLEALLRQQTAGPCPNTAVSHQPSSRDRRRGRPASQLVGVAIDLYRDDVKAAFLTCDCERVRERGGGIDVVSLDAVGACDQAVVGIAEMGSRLGQSTCELAATDQLERVVYEDDD